MLDLAWSFFFEYNLSLTHLQPPIILSPTSISSQILRYSLYIWIAQLYLTYINPSYTSHNMAIKATDQLKTNEEKRLYLYKFTT